MENLDFLQDTGKFHFLGSIVLNTQPNPNNDDVEYYEIVDGQQRITTIILILIVIAQIFKERGEEALFQGLLPYILYTNINNQTSSTLHSNAIQYDANVDYKLHNKQKKDFMIEKCLKYYYNELKTRDTNAVASLCNALVSTNYVNIKTTGEDSYTVFEILNARGLDFESHELLKKFILRYTIPINNIDIARQEWKDEIKKSVR